MPALLIDAQRDDDGDVDRHPGTNDLDIGLALALLDDERYAEISSRLRAEGFRPDTNANGNQTVQRWRLGELKVTVDFLMAPAPAQDGNLRTRRTIPLCGPAAFVVLKALAFGDRAEPKDAYDLVYVIRHTPGRGEAIAARLAVHAKQHSEIVARALGLLARDFDAPDTIGPARAAEFSVAREDEIDDAVADAHGFVDDLLHAARHAGLIGLKA